jgi:DNA-binding transcriptional regulator LsrR (DeoR family)
MCGRQARFCKMILVFVRGLMTAPGIAGSLGAREAFVRDPHVAEVLRKARSANLAFMGIGAPRPDSILVEKGKIVTWQELAALKKRGAVETLTYAILMDDVNVFLPT